MKKVFYLILIIMGLLLGCAPDLVVTNVRLNNWDENNKSVTATVKNVECSMPIFCEDAEEFLVYFDGEELPISNNYRPQVSKNVASLDSGDSIDINADFTPLERPENNYLWNVNQITVTADPKGQVKEAIETNNVNSTDIPFSSKLPIMIIDTLGATVQDEPKIPADMKIIYDYAGGRSFINAFPNDYDGRIGIELRGQLTAGFCKRQYGIETWDQLNNDIDFSLLQLPAEEDWVLYGPYSDKSLMRNFLVYNISNLIGRYAPRTKFVEVFINDPGLPMPNCPAVASDNYIGVYVLIEKIKRGANRVNITKLRPTDNNEPEITGGYILKKDWTDPGDVYFTTSSATGYGTRIIYVYPKCKAAPQTCDATTQQKAWIESYINDFEAALKGSAFADPVNGYAKYIDVDSFVDFYLIQEVFKNSDGFRGSMYMHKDRNGKLKMGPVWDFNFSMGNVGFSSARPTDGWLLGAVSGQMAWWGRLLEDGAFIQKIIDRWQVLRSGQFKTSNIHLTIDNTAKYLKYAQARNFSRWPILGVAIVGNPPPVDPNELYEDVIQYMKTWIEARMNWIDTNINTLQIP